MELVPMTPMKILILPDGWNKMYAFEKDIRLKEIAFNMVIAYLKTHINSLPSTTLEHGKLTCLIRICMANHYCLEMTIIMDPNIFSFSVNLFLYKNGWHVRASNIGYNRGKYFSKSYNNYEDMMTEIAILSYWAAMDHIIVDN